LNLIHDALIDPYDQSLWFYHACLMAAFDPTQAPKSIAPNLSREQRLNYLEGQVAYVFEILEDTSDCKWVYQTLIDLARLYKRNAGSWPPRIQAADILQWMEQLEKLDPLRMGRWADLKAELVNT
jgi:geranylgeranyl transferase type-2 subunit alpha